MIPFGCVIHICACMYINIYAYLTTYIHIYKHTHWASPGSHCSQIISKHFLGGQIFFFLFQMVYAYVWPKPFVQVEFLMLLPELFLRAAMPPLWSQFPTDTPHTIPVSFGMILTFDLKLSPLGPANDHLAFVPFACGWQWLHLVVILSPVWSFNPSITIINNIQLFWLYLLRVLMLLRGSWWVHTLAHTETHTGWNLYWPLSNLIPESLSRSLKHHARFLPWLNLSWPGMFK